MRLCVLVMLLLASSSFAEELPENLNTVHEFRLEERDYYRIPSSGGKNYAFLKDNCYGWWHLRDGRPSSLYFSRKGFGYVHFPIPAEDAVLPVFQRLYRVHGLPEEYTQRKFIEVGTDQGDEKPRQDAPSMIVPLRRDGIGHLSLLRRRSEGTLKLIVDEIRDGRRGTIASGTAIIAPLGGAKQTIPLELHVGMEFSIDERHVRVLKIVPASSDKRKTVGWVELDVAWE